MVAGAISLVLLVCVILNLWVPETVPAQLSSFLFGCLACTAVGYTVVSPRSSALSLSADGENKFRRSQYVVGMILSLLLALAFLLTELRAVPSSWLLVPVIFLTPVLLLRHLVINNLPGREQTAMHGRHQVEKDQDESA
jgi:cell division protein FtsW (lipid II flippase)